jgi:hypothetical protein
MCIKQVPPNIKFGFKLEEIKTKYLHLTMR